jgi:hypothetical protein
MEMFSGPKAPKALAKLSGVLREWRDEPLALSVSHPKIRTLPAWFSANATAEQHETLCRIEAGYFLKNPEAWHWQQLPCKSAPGEHPDMEKQLLMFFPADPCRAIERHVRSSHHVTLNCMHVAPLLFLSTFTATMQHILEIEEGYVIFFSALNGKITYYRYWPVKSGSEREYFCIRELMALPGSRELTVEVTGSAAEPAMLKRLSQETGCNLEPLKIPDSIGIMDQTKGKASSSAAVRAISAALMALSANRN